MTVVWPSWVRARAIWLWLRSGLPPESWLGGPVWLPDASGFRPFGGSIFSKSPPGRGQIAEAAAGGEGQGAAPGLGPGQRAGVRLPARGPSSTPLPHQGLGWRVLGAPGLLELWRERQGGERWFLGVPEPGERERESAEGWGRGWRGCLGRREGRKEEVRCREMRVEGWGV